MERQVVCFLSQLMIQTLMLFTNIYSIPPCIHTSKREVLEIHIKELHRPKCLEILKESR